MTELSEADRKAFEEWWGINFPFEEYNTKCAARSAWQAALTHARGEQQEPAAWQWRGLKGDTEPTSWMPQVSTARPTWEALVARDPSKYRIEERALYAAPPAEREELARLRAENERLTEALTPSGDTKAAYWGEFSFHREQRVESDDDDDDDAWETVSLSVPWTVIKEIMAAIRARAALAATNPEGN